MENEGLAILVLLIGIIAGGASYLIVQFWMNPLLRYLSIKHEVTSDLVFYANVINADGLNKKMQERHRERQDQNRKHASEIRASYYRLPWWYKRYLSFVKEDPVGASKALIGLSNTSEYDLGDQHTKQLIKCMRIPDNVED